ncbi:beta-1,3-galactosyltransferase 5 [Neocloeon triangulifer]|uniref:beta-1,3-galactosyltransferase 5 n=1 Tax=Neocloeon triangulifer TaxID=2078957 RepID=UPI00286ECD5C|nr:beta-1,3-galactosyltransferase 5 [Neocloeon triangulifer]XP_059469520.1 beta-1,3-galactosyltransferase 5 [Neocloeon triangulifer]
MLCRVRMFYSLMLGLTGFSLMLCSFFYASPASVNFEVIGPNQTLPEVLPSSLQQIQSQPSAETEAISQSARKEEPSELVPDAKLNQLESISIPESAIPESPDEAKTAPIQQPQEEVAPPVVIVAATNITSKATTEELEAKSEPVAVAGAASPESAPSAATVAAIKPAKESVIQKIAPLAAVAAPSGLSGVPSSVVATKDLYESGHDIPNAELCPEFGAGLKLLILITSAPTHADARKAIRLTWGTYGHRKDMAVGFLVGGVSDEKVRSALYSESELYGDIIQSHFFDSYDNLTLKTVSALEWIDTYCYQARFILKTDDDMFINVPRLLQFVDKHANDKRSIYGRLAKKWKPIRNKKSKYYVSKEQYKQVLFPDFTTGPAYLMTSDVVHDLYMGALNLTYLKLEDVYTTGIVAQQLKIKRLHASEFLNKRITWHACHVIKGISFHMVKFHEQFDLWKKLQDGKTKCK